MNGTLDIPANGTVYNIIVGGGGSNLTNGKDSSFDDAVVAKGGGAAYGDGGSGGGSNSTSQAGGATIVNYMFRIIDSYLLLRYIMPLFLFLIHPFFLHMFAQVGGSGVPGQGHDGARGDDGDCSGGGGGAGAPGGNGLNSTCLGNGGDGKQSNITGTLVWYAG